MRIKVDINQAAARLRDLRERARQPAPLLAAIGAELLKTSEWAFEDQKSPEGARWLPLKKSTIARRRKKGAGAQILKDTGHLRGSGRVLPAAGSVTVQFHATAKNGFDYAAAHQHGNSRVPARPFVPRAPLETIPTKAARRRAIGKVVWGGDKIFC